MEILSRVIFEVAGSPKEHLTNFLNKLLAEIRGRQNLEIVKEDIAEPLERENKIWTSFMELEIKFKTLEDFLNFILDYSPSSIEIIEPEEITVKNVDLSKFLNDYSHKIIQLTLAFQNLQAENLLLKKRLGVTPKKGGFRFKVK